MVRALMIRKDDSIQTVAEEQISLADLPDGDVLVRVAFSTLNYKDALAITGKAPVVRQFPMVPGIDFTGLVEDSQHPEFSVGDQVILNGWGVGETHWGGLADYARVKGDWLIKLPDEIDLRMGAAIGTAGYTAMLCVQALQAHNVTPDQGEVAVSGAAGGVGSVAISLLAGRGFSVAAVTGRKEQAPYLTSLGASRLLDRADFVEKGKPLAREQFAAAIDVAGSHVLANLLAATKYNGVVAACGLAAGLDLPTTVAPFILRGVTLAGVDSVMCPKAERQAAWQALAAELDQAQLNAMVTEIGFDEVISTAPKFLSGQVRGRLVVPIAPQLG